MDRDIALQITQKITAINTALQTLVTNTTPTQSDNRSVPAEAQRSAPDPEDIPEAQRSAPDPEDIPEQDPEPEPNKK